MQNLFDIDNYYFNPFSIPLIITIISLLFIWTLLKLLRGKSYPTKSLLIELSFLMIWFGGYALMYCSLDEDIALFWGKIGKAGVIFIPIGLLDFVTLITNEKENYRKYLNIGWFGGFFFLLLLFPTNFLIIDIKKYFWGYYPIFNWTSVFFFIYFIIGSFLALNLLYKYIKYPGIDKISRKSYRLFFTAAFIAYIAVVDFLPNLGIGIYPFGYLPIIIFVVISSRTIIKYHFLEIFANYGANEIIELMSESLCIVDENLIIRKANKSAFKLFNLSPKELIDKNINDFYNIYDEIKQLDKMQKVITTEKKLKIQDKLIFHKISITAIYSSFQKPYAYIILIEDITEQKLLQEKLYKYTNELEKLVKERTSEIEKINYSLLEDIKKRREVESQLNKRIKIEKLTKEISTNFLKKNYLEIDDEVKNTLKKICDFFDVERSFIYQLSNYDENIFKLRYEYYTSVLNPILEKDKQLDVTKFTQSFKKLNEANYFLIKKSDLEKEEFENQNDLSKEFLFIKNLFEEIEIKSLLIVPIYSNEKITGFLGLESLFKEINFSDEDITLLQVISGIIINALNRKVFEEELQNYVLELTDSRNLIEQNANELAILNYKLSESEEQLKKSIAEKDKFFSIISHDLRSPFMGLLGLTQLIVEDFDSIEKEEMKSIMFNLHNSLKNLYSLIENLLTWSRLQTGKIPYNPTDVCLSESFDKVFNLLNPLAQNKNITLNFSFQNEQSMKVYVDNNMLHSILQNLISNAIKFTNKNGTITITASRLDNFIPEKDFSDDEQWESSKGVHSNIPSRKIFDDWVEIKIQDTGIGISKNNLRKLFKVGEHFTTNGTNNESGTGLGLILVKELVEKNYGTISVESEVGKGTTFIIRLPSKN